MNSLKLGHVHLKVRDLDKAIAFYTTVAGLQVEEIAGSLAFLSDGVVHHAIALQALGPYASPPNPHGIGLYHTAFEVKNEEELKDAYLRVTNLGVRIYPVDHRISWALYFSDPDGNGVEIYLDKRYTMAPGEVWGGISEPLSPSAFGV